MIYKITPLIFAPVIQPEVKRSASAPTTVLYTTKTPSTSSDEVRSNDHPPTQDDDISWNLEFAGI